MNSPVNLEDIARKAGVSTMAVSLALRNSSKISATRRRQIQKLAKKLGYRPNPLVSALMASRKTRRVRDGTTIACIDSCDNVADLQTLPWWNYHIKGIKERAQELGFAVDHVHAREFDYNDMRLNKALKARGIRGIIFLYASTLEMDVKLEWNRFACVKLLSHYPSASMHLVKTNISQEMQTILKRLTDYGYTRIGLAVAARDDDESDNAINGAFLYYQSRLPSKCRVPVFRSLAVPWAAYRTKGDLYQWYRRCRPDVILSFEFDYHRELEPFGVRVPRDVAWAYKAVYRPDGKRAGLLLNNTTSVGRAATDVLTQLMYTNNYGLPHNPMTIMVLSTNWVDGVTVPIRKKQAMAAAGQLAH